MGGSGIEINVDVSVFLVVAGCLDAGLVMGDGDTAGHVGRCEGAGRDGDNGQPRESFEGVEA